MARASVNTLLPLKTFGDIMGIDPFEFNQVQTPYSDTYNCRDVFYQFPYQVPNYITREEIARAIATAEDMLAQWLGYPLAPKYIVNEQQGTRTPMRRQQQARNWRAIDVLWSYGYGYGLRKIQLNQQRYIGGGLFARSLIGAMAVTRADLDGDGVLESFSGTIATTLTDASEIGAYFNLADRASAELNETWRLRPVTVSIAAGVATITGHASLLVLPTLQIGYNAVALEVADPTIYATSLDVYRAYTDSTQQGAASWQPYEYDCPAEPCTLSTQAICIVDDNGKQGQVAYTYADGACCLAWREPDFVNVNYLAGAPLVNQTIDRTSAEYIAHLAAGLLPNLPCGCERADSILQYWRQNMTETYVTAAGVQQPVALTPDDLRSPFGYSRGALDTWRKVRDKQQSIGISV